MRDGFADRLKLRARLTELSAGRDRHPRGAREEHWRDLTSGFHSYHLGLAHQYASQTGVELRFPFYDLRLAEACLAIPADMRVQDGVTRLVARQAMAGIVPDEVRLRPQKALFTGAYARGLKLDRTLVQEALSDTGPMAEYVDTEALRRVYVAMPAPATRKHHSLIFRAAALGLWLERHWA